MDDMHAHRLEVLRRQYPPGAAVELIHMDDPQSPQKGTRGEIIQVDDLGTIHVAWRNGSTLGVVPGIDMVRKLDEEIPVKISR